jgi:hypothetical protein
MEIEAYVQGSRNTLVSGELTEAGAVYEGRSEMILTFVEYRLRDDDSHIITLHRATH